MAFDTPAVARARSGETVGIACKHPQGLILNLDQYVKLGDQNQVRRVSGASTVTLRGWARQVGVQPDTTDGGYQITHVSRDFWDVWFKANRESALILDKIILPPASDARAQAIEHEEIKQMFRPAHPSDRSPDRASPGVEIATRDDA